MGAEAMNWITVEFEQLTSRELYLIMRARSAVFVVEQCQVCLDADGHDEDAIHVFGIEDRAKPMPIIAYARIHPGDAEDPHATLDKVLTSPAHRGDGTAEILIERALMAVLERWPTSGVRVSAPVDLRGFYEQFGFRKTEGPFLERGVPFIRLTCQPRGVLSRATARERGTLPAVNTYELL